MEGSVEAFLRALFSNVPPGFIEVRLIEERERGKVLARRWYPGADALLDVLPGINEFAEKKGAGIFFGVLPRRANGVGKAEDTLPGFAAWTDLDFKDFEGGEEECRKKLDSFPTQPTAVIRSGHGLHAYWFTREPQEPQILVKLSKKIATVVGGDSVSDAARLLRLPGTANRKNPEELVPVTVESFSPERRYSPDDLEKSLPALPEELRGDGNSDIVIEERISRRVQKLLSAHPHLHNLFEGRGKPSKDEYGRRIDTTSSGYDYSFVCALARKGVTDESELATALYHRPDDAARAKGLDYIARTVRKALDRVTVTKQSQSSRGGNKNDESKIDFTVDRVRIFTSNPRIYEITVSSVPIRLSTSDLLSPSRFRIRYTDAIGRVPELPTKSAWRKQVNIWFAQAETVEQPPEASATALLCEQIMEAVRNFATGETIDDLDRGKSLEHDGELVFKTTALLKILRDTCDDNVSSHILCSHLRDLGFESKVIRVDGKAVRVWARGAVTENSSEEPSK
jgi:hypothetical protein